MGASGGAASAARRPRLAVVALLCGLCVLAGCSVVRVSYDQADRLAYWWLDRYVDFDGAQKPRVRDALTQWHAWHRRTHLPGYADLLARAQELVGEKVTAGQVCGMWTEVLGYMDDAFERAMPATVEIAATLTPRQLLAIERRYDESGREFREENLQGDAAARLEKSVERTIERFEFFYGRLDGAQQALITRMVADSPYDAHLWNTERLRRQADFLQVLRRLQTGVGLEEGRALLHAYVGRIHHSPDEAYRSYTERLSRYNCTFVSQFHATTTPAQRTRAAAKFRGWESDLRTLSPSTQTSGLVPRTPGIP